MTNAYIAVDFGGGSGRVMAASIHGSMLRMEEVHRFPNRQVWLGNHLYWDFLALFDEMKQGLKKAVQKGYFVRTIGIDTWGVDFGLIDEKGNLLGNPICYRDTFTDGLPGMFFDDKSIIEHYAVAGIQVMPINTLFQLYGMQRNGDSALSAATRLLFMPDLFSFFLTGVSNNEYCIASTSELLDARRQTWNDELIGKMGLPRHLFGEIVMPGCVRGEVKSSICEETGLLKGTQVLAVGSHDTASAVFAIPSTKKRTGFLSSGTWSLLGVELDKPILTEEARKAGFTNEGGVGGKIRFLQNITGLWMLQKLMAQWKERGEVVEYEELIAEAELSSISSLIDVDDKRFQNPGNMENEISACCWENGSPTPVSKGDFVRCVLQSLALRYRKAVTRLNTFLPEPIEQLNIVGGGARNRLLNQLTSEALGIPVLAGPFEATAIGNILVQAISCRDIKDKDEIKEFILI